MHLAKTTVLVISLTLLTLVVAHPSSVAFAQNPVPLVDQPLIPASIAPGSGGFILTVNGAGFVSGSKLSWNYSPRPTTFVSSTQLTASISASDVSHATTALVAVASPSPGGGSSNTVFFPVRNAAASLAFHKLAYGASGDDVVVADFNHDGKLDLAVLQNSAAMVVILLGNGNGTFQPSMSFPVPAAFGGTQQMTVGDFNGDGNLDLATINSVLLGNGNGTFQAAIPYTSDSPETVVAADVNGDGNLDLVTGNALTSTISVLLGNGNGTFQPFVDFGPANFSVDITAGDFNHDGNIDVAAADLNGIIHVLLGNGNGTFQPSIDVVTRNFDDGLAAADFNADGNLDIALTTDTFFEDTGALGILTGDGAGGFQHSFSAPISPFAAAGSVSVADLNGDGTLDLLIGEELGFGSYLLGNGNGSFQTRIVIPGSFQMAVGDFDRDGKVDIVNALGQLLLQQ